VEQHFLHPWLVALFLLLFTIMSIVGLMRLIRERNMFGSVLLLMSTLVFGYSTWIAATLHG
jgi:NADH:ubiquinone oxidoreductase subunit 6 (subunit J)